MSGAATLLLLLLCCQVFAYDDIEPPQGLNIAVPILGEVVVTWKHSVAPKNRSARYDVNFSTPDKKIKLRKLSQNFTRTMLALHGGLMVQVAAYACDSKGNSFSNTSKWISADLPPYPGVNGTSATNLSCQIHLTESEKSLLSCKWAPGDKAPADTVYNLYYRYKNVTEKCQEYKTEPGGQRRIECHILSTVISPKMVNEVLIHINGSSKSLKIKPMEQIFLSRKIEIIPPVRNLTVSASGLCWEYSISYFSETCFQYQINIWSKDRNETITVKQLCHFSNIFQKPPNRQFIRVRAVGGVPCFSSNSVYSEWTDMIHIGEDIVRIDVLGIIVSVCLIVTCIFIFFLCIAFWGHIFPQIPKPKNDLKMAFQNVQSQALMRCNSWDNEEVISYIEELVESDKYKMSSDYGTIIHSVDCVNLCDPAIQRIYK